MERNDVAMWKKRVQDEGHRFGVPGVPAKAQELGGPSAVAPSDGILTPASLSPSGVWTSRRRVDAGRRTPGRSGEQGRKEKPGLGEIHARDDDGV